MAGSLEERLEILESRLAFQEHTLESLNQVITRQDRELVELKQGLAEVSARLKDFDASGSEGAAGTGHEIPPHY